MLDVLEYFGYTNNGDNDDQDCDDCGYFFCEFNGLIKSLTHGEISFAIPNIFHQVRNVTIVVPKYGEAPFL